MKGMHVDGQKIFDFTFLVRPSRSIADDHWHEIEARHMEAWSDATTLLKHWKYVSDGCAVTVTTDWEPLLGRLRSRRAGRDSSVAQRGRRSSGRETVQRTDDDYRIRVLDTIRIHSASCIERLERNVLLRNCFRHLMHRRRTRITAVLAISVLAAFFTAAAWTRMRSPLRAAAEDSYAVWIALWKGFSGDVAYVGSTGTHAYSERERCSGPTTKFPVALLNCRVRSA